MCLHLSLYVVITSYSIHYTKLYESAKQVEALMARENARGVPDAHIVLAGFSQGGAIALHTEFTGKAARGPGQLPRVATNFHIGIVMLGLHRHNASYNFV